jgi:hypothetical protein
MSRLAIGSPPLFGYLPVGAVPLLVALALLAWRAANDRWLPWLGPVPQDPADVRKWTMAWFAETGGFLFRVALGVAAASMIAQVLYAGIYVPRARTDSLLVFAAGLLLVPAVLAHGQQSPWAATGEFLKENAWKIAGVIAVVVVFWFVRRR